LRREAAGIGSHVGVSAACVPPARELEGWLRWIAEQHPVSIELTLDRVRHVADRLHIAPSVPVITVGGTNGKGSTCAMLEAMLDRAGYRTGLYTSPHLLRYNERVRISRREADDDALCRAFAAVEAARGEVSLTYFEFGTLAALWLMREASVDVMILEVGMGGRLDAVNIVDADCAVVASVDLDHMEFLGDTRDRIGFEKAGIFRASRPAVCGDPDPPPSLVEHARAIGARLLVAGVDFSALDEGGGQWRYRGPGRSRYGLPFPALRGDYQLGNAAVAITALDTVSDRLPVSAEAVRTGLLTAEIPGRFQVVPGRPTVILDVAHNPHAARVLARSLSRMPPDGGRTIAVFSMLGDKDIEGVVREVKACIDAWYVAPTDGARSTPVSRLREALTRASALDPTHEFDTLPAAWRAAREAARDNDRIVVFGSFHTVAEVLPAIRSALAP